MSSIGEYTLKTNFDPGDVTSKMFNRCHIPECDDIENPSYNADFVQHAIPQIQSTFAKCQKYSYNDTFLVSEWLNSNIQMDQLNVCPKEAFDQSEIVRCDGDGFIYRTDEISIANEVR